jgi:hypothetical protein
MKRKVILAFVLLVVFSSHLFSETLDCQQSFEHGEHTAKIEHSFRRWYIIGIGSVLLAGYAAITIDDLLFSVPGYLDSEWSLALPLGGGAAVLISSFIYSFISPRREKIFHFGGDLDLECYRDGYKKIASRRNSSALLLGELTALFAGYAVLLFFLSG